MKCDACGKQVVAAFETSEGERWCPVCLAEVADIADKRLKREREIDAFMDRMKRKP